MFKYAAFIHPISLLFWGLSQINYRVNYYTSSIHCNNKSFDVSVYNTHTLLYFI